MSLILVVYPPGAGGNHLKNLLCLSGVFTNSEDLDPSVYDFLEKDRAPGEVYMKGGRNLQQIYFDKIQDQSNQVWILPAHFGEMCQYQSELDKIKNKKIIIIDISNIDDRRRLDERQLRLGQAIHPYWLDEELVWLYKPEIYTLMFGLPYADCLSIGLGQLWHFDFVSSSAFTSILEFINVKGPLADAVELHSKWMAANFANIDCK